MFFLWLKELDAHMSKCNVFTLFNLVQCYSTMIVRTGAYLLEFMANGAYHIYVYLYTVYRLHRA